MYLILEYYLKHFFSQKCPLCCGLQQDFKVAWLCCCNLSSSQTDSSLQLMNVTHLSRLAQPSGERGRGLGLRNMKKSKKIKKSTWKVLTFVVYYRIHLNLNLEASARQWPHHYRAHSLVGKSTLKPLKRRVALDQSQSCQYNSSLTGDLALTGVCCWAFLPVRALVVLKVSRRTLWPYLWEILDTVT